VIRVVLKEHLPATVIAQIMQSGKFGVMTAGKKYANLNKQASVGRKDGINDDEPN
jgi:hypothetical protein